MEGQDYSLNAQTGVITNLGKSTAANTTVKASYNYTDPTKVTPADIIGTVNPVGDRTGMKLLNDSFNLFGYFAKILIAPVFCTQNSVSVELITMTKKPGAVFYIDAQVGTTFAQVLAGCDPEGTISFNTSSDWVRLCYQNVKVYDPETNTEHLEPLSQRAAGLRAKVDLDKRATCGHPPTKKF